MASLQLGLQRLIAVSDNIAELTRVTTLWVSSRFSFGFALTPLQLGGNAMTAIPAGVFAVTQLTELNVRRRGRRAVCSRVAAQLMGNRLAAIPPEIGRLTPLKVFNVSRSPGRLATSDLFRQLSGNALVALPREIGRLTALEQLGVSSVLPSLRRLTARAAARRQRVDGSAAGAWAAAVAERALGTSAHLLSCLTRS